MLGLQLIEIAINKALPYNSAGTESLKKLNGTSFKVSIDLPEKPALVEGIEALLSIEPLTKSNQFEFIISFLSTEIVISQDSSIQTSAGIAGNPPAVFRWLMGSDSNSGININGELATLQAIQKWLSTVDIDWEDLLADSIGDTPVATAKMAKQELERLLKVVAKSP